jgi:hypothetical protein
MDSATNVITVVCGIVTLLQVVTIFLVINTRKKVIKLIDDVDSSKKSSSDAFKREQPKQQFQNGSQPNRDRRNDRPPREQQPREPQSQESQPGISVDKSLRDINLKLKNAERSQESARKKIQDDFRPPRGNRPDNRRRDNNSNRRFNNGNNPTFNKDRDNSRDHDNNRDNNRDRDNNRGNNRGSGDNFQRNRNPQRFENTETAIEKPIQELNPAVNEQAAPIIIPIAPEMPEINRTIETMQESADTNLQHGRKFSIKRRALTEENESENATENSSVETVQTTDSFDSRNAVSAESSQQTPSEQQPTINNDTETQQITFGRR